MHNRKGKPGSRKRLITYQVLCCSDYGNSNYEQKKQSKGSQGVSANE